MSWLGDIAGSVVNTVGDIVGAKYQSDLQGHQQDKAFEQSHNEAEIAFNREQQAIRDNFAAQNKREDEVWEREKAYNADIWQKQNEYNSPAAQMARFKEAGLNPLLAYSQGNPGNAVAIHSEPLKSGSMGSPSYSPARKEPAIIPAQNWGTKIMSGMLNYVGIRQKGLENQNLAAENSLRKAQADKAWTEAEIQRRELENMKKSGMYLYDPQMMRFGSRLFKYWSRIDPKGASWWNRFFNDENDTSNPRVNPIKDLPPRYNWGYEGR